MKFQNKAWNQPQIKYEISRVMIFATKEIQVCFWRFRQSSELSRQETTESGDKQKQVADKPHPLIIACSKCGQLNVATNMAALRDISTLSYIYDQKITKYRFNFNFKTAGKTLFSYKCVCMYRTMILLSVGIFDFEN